MRLRRHALQLEHAGRGIAQACPSIPKRLGQLLQENWQDTVHHLQLQVVQQLQHLSRQHPQLLTLLLQQTFKLLAANKLAMNLPSVQVWQ